MMSIVGDRRSGPCGAACRAEACSGAAAAADATAVTSAAARRKNPGSVAGIGSSLIGRVVRGGGAESEASEATTRPAVTTSIV